MADNTTLGVGSGGDVIATDDIAGVKYQRVKVNFGADGSATDVAATAPLPVVITDGTNPVVTDATGADGEAANTASVVTSARIKVFNGTTWDRWRGKVMHVADPTRTELRFYAVGVTAGTTATEALVTLTKSSGVAATSTANTFVVTSGKRFRIKSITYAMRGNVTATAAVVTFNIRVNTAGAVATTSTPVILAARTATPATALAWDRINIPLPIDGIELVGDGTMQWGLSVNPVFTTNAPTYDVMILADEYTP